MSIQYCPFRDHCPNICWTTRASSTFFFFFFFFSEKCSHKALSVHIKSHIHNIITSQLSAFGHIFQHPYLLESLCLIPCSCYFCSNFSNFNKLFCFCGGCSLSTSTRGVLDSRLGFFVGSHIHLSGIFLWSVSKIWAVYIFDF